MFVCFHLELAIYNSKISKNGFTLKAGLYPAEQLKTKKKKTKRCILEQPLCDI